MQTIRKTLVAVVTILVMTLAMTNTHADGHGGESSTWYINPAVGYQSFNSDRGLDNETFLALGLEYRYGTHWASEILWMDSSPDFENVNADSDLTQVIINAIYYTNDTRDERFDPYFLLGLGQAEFDSDFGDEEETQIFGGWGARIGVTDNLSLKTDLKLVFSHDEDVLDSIFSLGLSYAFGGQSKPMASTAPAAAPSNPDSDGDGVVDSSDACPGTPAGVSVDQRGCALDSDNDGVADYKDQCLETPPGREVDEKGCKYVLTRTEEITLNVNFATNSDVVTNQYMSEIEAVANFMKRFADVSAVIEGHTDSTGNADYNVALSERRARSVMKVLIENFGINPGRLSAEGFGAARPIATNDTAAGRSANRRVVAVMKAEISE